MTIRQLKKLTLIGLAFCSLTMSANLFSQNSIRLRSLDAYHTGIFDDGAAEIVAHDPETQRLFVVNGGEGAIDVYGIADPYDITKLFSIDVTPYGKQANSVDVYDEVVAAAIENDDKQAPGFVVFFDNDGNYINQLTVGALPDMLTFTPNGKAILVANEGEPNDDYTVDPEGSISIIKIDEEDIEDLTQSNVRTLGFSQYNNQVLDPSIRVFGPGASVAQDFEPEYIAVSEDSKTAWVVIQENNAMAIVDVRRGRIKDVVGLGLKDHSIEGNGFDASNRDGKIDIKTHPVWGMYQPDGMASFNYNGRPYVITMNEGDSREYEGDPGFVDEDRIKDFNLDPTAFPNAEELQEDENLGRLKATITEGDYDNDGDYDALYSYGARSFSIWDRYGNQIYDSGDALERITALALPDEFNSTDDENDSFDNRSDDKGPEPEGVAVARLGGKTYAFLGLERIGGIVVYDVSNPYAPEFVQYINSRDFSGDAEGGTAGPLSPEGLEYISKDDSPIDVPLLVVAYEVSGSVEVFAVEKAAAKTSDFAAVSQTLPQSFELQQNFPNPFNPSTTISFSVPKDVHVKIKVVDIQGRAVATLIDAPFGAGAHQVNFQANALASGQYLYTLEINGVVQQIRKMNLIK